LTAETPREAVEATLALLASELSDTGFALKPGLMLRRKVGDLTHSLRAQPNKSNREGQSARFRLSAWLESAELSAWKKAQAPDRPAAVAKFDSFVLARDLNFLGSPHHGDWDVVDPGERPAAAASIVEIVRSDTLPWFDKVSDPVSALDELMNGSLHSSIIEFAVATGNAEAARRRIAAIAAEKPKIAEVLERLRRDGKPAAFRDGLEPIVWTAIDAGVA